MSKTLLEKKKGDKKKYRDFIRNLWQRQANAEFPSVSTIARVAA